MERHNQGQREHDALASGARFTFGVRIVSELVVYRLRCRCDGAPLVRVCLNPQRGQFIQSPIAPSNSECHFLSRFLRCSSTSSVVYHGPRDCARRASSSSLAPGETASHSDKSIRGEKSPSTLPEGSQSSTGPVSSSSLRQILINNNRGHDWLSLTEGQFAALKSILTRPFIAVCAGLNALTSPSVSGRCVSR